VLWRSIGSSAAQSTKTTTDARRLKKSCNVLERVLEDLMMNGMNPTEKPSGQAVSNITLSDRVLDRKVSAMDQYNGLCLDRRLFFVREFLGCDGEAGRREEKDAK